MHDLKVLLINGSPRPRGCTYTALVEIAHALEDNSIHAEIFHVGTKPIRGCMACGLCIKRNDNHCAYNDDWVNEAIDKAADCDGFIFGTPVHYASGSGAAVSFLDRAFYAGSKNFAYKPGACVVSCRRGGATSTFDQMNKYFTINNMPVVSSQYWNMVHGNTPEEVRKDLEGMQIMRTLGHNMAWLLKCIESGKELGVTLPEPEKRIATNFIR